MDKAKLVKMANQIAANLDYRGDSEEVVAERVADHFRRFWDPLMRRELLEHSRQHGDELMPAARLAVQSVAAEQNVS